MAASTASATAFTVETSTARVVMRGAGPVPGQSTGPRPAGAARPATAVEGVADLEQRKVHHPRAWLRAAACKWPGSSAGRMWYLGRDRVFKITSSSAPPSKSRAEQGSMKDRVTAFVVASAAAVRRPASSRSAWAVEHTVPRHAGSGGRRSGSAGLGQRVTRATSSTRSAITLHVGRQVGTQPQGRRRARCREPQRGQRMRNTVPPWGISSNLQRNHPRGTSAIAPRRS